jgi:hypothetical protein
MKNIAEIFISKADSNIFNIKSAHFGAIIAVLMTEFTKVLNYYTHFVLMGAICVS